MNRKWTTLLLAGALVLAASALQADERSRDKNVLTAQLKPTNEVPALSSVASGKFRAVVNEANQTISYEVSYEGLEGKVIQSHIHIGQPGVNGGVSVFLCANPPAGPPAGFPVPPLCPTSPATVTGVLTPANIIGPNAQGVAPSTATSNEWAELVRAIRNRVTYANVHTDKFPAGEIRGAVRVGGDRDDD